MAKKKSKTGAVEEKPAVAPSAAAPRDESILIGRGDQRRLDLTLLRGNIADVNTRALILGVFANVDPDGAARAVDQRLGGTIRDIVRARMFSPDSGSIFILPTPRTPLRTDFVVLAGLGSFDRFGPPVIELVSANIVRTLIRANIDEFATILLGGSSGQEPATCTAHLLRGVLAGVRDADAARQFRGMTLVEIDRKKYPEIREQIYAACREPFCDDFEIVVREIDAPEPEVPRAATARPTSAPGQKSPIYLLLRTEGLTPTRLSLKAAALTAGAKAALLDDRVDIDLRKLRPLIEKIEMQDFNIKQLESFGKAIAATALPARVRDELERSRGHHLTVVHDREASLIPWEAIRFDGWVPALDLGMSRRYLASDVAVARWSEQRRADPDLRLLLVVNPTGDLDGADREGARIEDLTAKNSRIRVDSLRGTKATAKAVLEAIGSERFDVVHYAGHAFFEKEAPAQSGILCADRTLRAEELLNLRNLPALMFFNACESARLRRGARGRRSAVRAGAARTLSTSVGFAEALMRAGVANYVGTYWPVGDAAAGVFAAVFYAAILDGLPLARALLDARKAVMKLKSIDWADYIHYGDPAFALKSRVQGAGSG